MAYSSANSITGPARKRKKASAFRPGPVALRARKAKKRKLKRRATERMSRPARGRYV